jgi:hypothetical protein
MDLSQRFALVQVGHLIKIHQLSIGTHYNIFGAEFVTTRLGSTVALHLRDERNPAQSYYIYLPKRYAKAFTAKDIEDINNDRVWWALVSNGPDPITKTFSLSIV